MLFYKKLLRSKTFLIIFLNSIILIIFLCIIEFILRTYYPIISYRMDVSSTIAKKAGWGPDKDKNGLFLCDFKHEITNKNKKNILTIGDSLLACNPKANFPFSKSIPGVFGDEIKKKYNLYNLAAGGWGTDQEFIAYQNYNPKKFDLVLLFYTPANDLFNNSTNKAIGQNLNKPFFSIRNDDLVLNYSSNNELNLFQKFIMDSELGKRLLIIFGKGIEEIFNLPIFDHKITSKYEHERYSHIAANFKPILPRYKESWEVTKKIFLNFKDEVEKNNGKFAIVYLPTGIRNLLDSHKNFPSNCIGYTETREDIYLTHNNNNLVLNPFLQYDLIKKFTAENNIALIDSHVNEFHKYAYIHNSLAPDCIHFNNPIAINIIVKSLKEFISSTKTN